MDHLRHHRNLVNPACLLSFKKYCLRMAILMLGVGQTLGKRTKKSSLLVVSNKGYTVGEKIAKCIICTITIKKPFVLFDHKIKLFLPQ